MAARSLLIERPAWLRLGVLSRGLGLATQPIDVVVSRALAKRLCECSVDELRMIEAHLIDVTPEAESADDH